MVGREIDAPSPAGRGAAADVRGPSLRASALLEIGGAATPIPVSMSDSARSTFGKLKLLLCRGPTTPARSAAFPEDVRASGFLAFSS